MQGVSAHACNRLQLDMNLANLQSELRRWGQMSGGTLQESGGAGFRSPGAASLIGLPLPIGTRKLRTSDQQTVERRGC